MTLTAKTQGRSAVGFRDRSEGDSTGAGLEQRAGHALGPRSGTARAPALVEPGRDPRGQIIQLGLEHQLVTPFTSFLAIDESRRVSDGKPKPVIEPWTNRPASTSAWQGLSPRTGLRAVAHGATELGLGRRRREGGGGHRVGHQRQRGRQRGLVTGSAQPRRTAPGLRLPVDGPPSQAGDAAGGALAVGLLMGI